jgi:uncharacterized protein
LISAQTQAEVERVLTYPKFKLSPLMQASLIMAFVPYMETVMLPNKLPNIPICRDPEDQIFMLIASAANADFLVTGDGDLLALANQFPIPIVSPQAFQAVVKPSA